MAALGHTVDSGSGASGNYASLNALEAAQQQDLTDGGGDTYTATCTTTGDKAADTTATGFSGWVTAAANYITVIAAAGHEAVKTGYDTDRYRLATNNATCLDIAADYVRIDGLQIFLANTSDTFKYGIFSNTLSAGNEIRISNCRIGMSDSAASAKQRGISIIAGNGIIKIWNTIIENWTLRGVNSNDTTTEIYNCIIYNCVTGISEVGGTTTVKNTASFANSGDDITGATADYCASDDNTGTNNVAESGGGAAWPDDFVDAANGDFTLKATSNLAGAGVNDPGSGLYSTDMDGDSYVVDSWSLGVDEIVAAPGGIVVLRRRRM